MSIYSSTDFGLEASLGNIPGYSTVNKFGEAEDCDNGVPTDVWDGSGSASSTDIWVPPTAARIHQITTDDANDTSAGTGARTIRIYGLKTWDLAETSEDIIMNGASNVPTVNSYVIIHRIKVLTWGTTGQNQGEITATADTDGTVTAMISPLFNQTQMCIYGVPSIQKFRMTKLFASIVKSTGSSQRGDGELLVMIDPATNVVDNTAWTNKENFQLVEANPPWNHDYSDAPKKMNGACIIKVQVTTNSNNTKCTAGFDGYLVDN